MSRNSDMQPARLPPRRDILPPSLVILSPPPSNTAPGSVITVNLTMLHGKVRLNVTVRIRLVVNRYKEALLGVGGLHRVYEMNEIVDFPNLEQTGDVAINGWAG